MIWLTWFDMLGVATFAVTGALAGARRRLDVFGIIALAIVTALGGGTVRDLLLGIQPVFWIEHVGYLLLAAGAGGVTCVAIRWLEKGRIVLLVLDAIGLATFTVLGVIAARAAGADALASVVLGMITGVVGGVIRDVLCDQVPLIFRSEIYAIASLVGGAAFIGAMWQGVHDLLAAASAMLIVLTIRLLAIVRRLALPTIASPTDSEPSS